MWYFSLFLFVLFCEANNLVITRGMVATMLTMAAFHALRDLYLYGKKMHEASGYKGTTSKNFTGHAPAGGTGTTNKKP